MGTTEGRWAFLTNHGHVLLALYRDADLRQRDLAHAVGITEGAVNRILTDLQAAGYVEVERIGRRNHYNVITSGDLRHPLEEGHCIGEVLERLAPEAAGERLESATT